MSVLNCLSGGGYNLNLFTCPSLYSAGSVLNGESSLSFTKEKGAALILHSGAYREDTLYDELFRKHMLLYYRQWYTFTLKKCYREIKLYDLVLVTGCDLSRQWAMASQFRDIGETNVTLRAQVAPLEDEVSLSAGWGLITRRGPPGPGSPSAKPGPSGLQRNTE